MSGEVGDARKRLAENRAATEAELRDMAQGCTELTCLYHGDVNAELRRRAGLGDR